MRHIRAMLLTASFALAATAMPAHAMKDTPSEPTSSSGSSGGATAVPEPGMLGIMGLALLGLAYGRRRQNRGDVG